MWDVGIQFHIKFQQILEESQIHSLLIHDSIHYTTKLFQQACKWMLNIIIAMIMFQSPFTTTQNKKRLVLYQEETFYKMNEVDTIQVMTRNECKNETNIKETLFRAYTTTLKKTTKSSENLPREIGAWDSDDYPIVVDSATS